MATTDFVMPLDRPHKCYLHECENLTTLAYASFSGPHKRQIEVEPRCHVHGYMEEVPHEGLRSIERFVVESLGGQGAALVFGVCPLEEIQDPDYELSVEDVNCWCPDEAWRVVYRDDALEKREYVVVWIPDDGAFELYNR